MYPNDIEFFQNMQIFIGSSPVPGTKKIQLFELDFFVPVEGSVPTGGKPPETPRPPAVSFLLSVRGSEVERQFG